MDYKTNKWSQIIKEKRSQGLDIYIVGDTETTGGVSKGTNMVHVYERDDPKYRGKMHRILELGFVFCTLNPENKNWEPIKDENGEVIKFHEYVNPFAEDKARQSDLNSIDDVPYGAYCVHGIDKNVLSGKTSLSVGDGKEIKIKAKLFQDLVNDFIKLTTIKEQEEGYGNIYSVFHNTNFDLTFMDSEFENSVDEEGAKNPRFQDMFVPYDTLAFFREAILPDELADLKEKSGIKKGKYALDTLVGIFTELGYMKNEYDRDLHGAYKDVLILIDLYNAVNDYKLDHAPKKSFVPINLDLFSSENNKKLKNN